MAVDTRVTAINATTLAYSPLIRVTQINASTSAAMPLIHVTQCNASSFRTLRNQLTRVTQVNASTFYYIAAQLRRRFTRLPATKPPARTTPDANTYHITY